MNELAQNTNCIFLGSDLVEDDPSVPQDEVEVMQENKRRKIGT